MKRAKRSAGPGILALGLLVMAVPSAAAERGSGEGLRQGLAALAAVGETQTPVRGRSTVPSKNAGGASELLAAYDQALAADLLLTERFAQVRERLEEADGPGLALERLAAAEARYQTLRSDLLLPLGEAMEGLREALAAGDAAPAPESAARAALARLAPALAQASAETEAPILAASQLPYRRLNLVARPPTVSPTVVPAYLDATDPAETSADLAATVDAPLSSEILTQAAALGHDYVRIYEFVRNEIATEHYAGAMKGAVETLAQGAGNDVDQASLLVALCRASNLPARYVQGVLELPVEALMASLGVADGAAVPAALAQAGLAHRPVVRGGRLAAIELEHTWVEVRAPYANYRGAVVDFSGKSWVPLVPAVKAVVRTSPTGVLAAMGYSVADGLASYLGAPQVLSPLADLRQEVETWLATNPAAGSYAAQLGSVANVPQTLGILPSTLPVAVVAITGEGAALPPSLQHRVRFRVLTGGEGSPPALDHELPLSAVASRRVTLSYQPATVDDHRTVMLFGGLDGVPAYLVSLRPVLRVDGRTVAVGEEPIPMGALHRYEIELAGPLGSERVSQVATAGAYYAVGLAGQRVVTRPDEGDGVGDEEALAARLLSRLALGYGARWDESEQELAGLLAVGVVRPVPSLVVAATVVGVETVGGLALEMEWEGVTLDAALRIAEPLGPPAAAQDFLRFSALEGSALEHLVFEQELQVASISADKGLGLARELGIPVLTVTSANAATLIPTLDHPPAVAAELENWARLGFSIDVPQTRLTLNAWQGSLWRVEDPATGAGGYFLSGGIAGGATTELPENWVLDLLADALAAPYSEEPNPDPLAAATMVKLGASDAQEGEVDTFVPRPLAVQVLDVDGRPVQGAAVRFLSISGGGKLRVNRDAEAPDVFATTDAQGIAEVSLRLGQHTADDPVFVRKLASDRYLSRALIHEVEAFVTGTQGLVALETPFTALGFAGPPVALRRTDAHVLEELGTAGKWVDTIFIAAEDRLGNPVSNVPVHFAAAVGQSVPGCTNDAPAAPPVVFDPRDDAFGPTACPVPFPQHGDCGVPSFTQETASSGAVAGVIMGESVVQTTRVLVSSPELPGQPPLQYGFGAAFVQHPGTGECSNFFGFDLFGPTQAFGGNAARAGDEFEGTIELRPASFELDVREISDGEGFRTQSLVTGHWGSMKVGGLRLQVSGGGSAALLAQDHPYAYRAKVRTGSVPGKNEVKVLWDSTCSFGGGFAEPDEEDPSWEIRYALSSLCSSGQNRDIPPVWGVEPTILGVSPFPLPLTDQGRLSSEAAVQYQILPADYTAGSAEILFYEDGQWIGVAQGSSKSGTGSATIQRGFVFDIEKFYEAELVLNRGGRSEVKGDRFVIPVTQGLFRNVAPPASVHQEVDLLNGGSCPQGSAFGFGLTQQAEVTLRFHPIGSLTPEGEPEFDSPLVALSGELLDEGDHSYLITPSGLGGSLIALPPGDYRWELEGTSTATGAVETLDGFIQSSYRTRDALAVGHAMVKGVDLWNGALVLSRQDFEISGRGAQLSFERTYASSDSGEVGPLGIGWTHNNDLRLVVTPCGEVILSGGDGSGMRFVDDGNGGLRPLKGYHGTLVANPTDFSWDFYSPGGMHYHYGLRVREEWFATSISDPNGNTTVLTYESGRSGTKVVAVTDSAGRQLRFTYQAAAFALAPPAEVITRVEGPGGLSLDLTYDTFGHLSRAEREKHPADSERNLPERSSRVETYTYADPIAAGLERRNLLLTATDEVTGAVTRYTYERSPVGVQGDIQVATSHVTAITEPLGGVTSIEIDTASLTDLGAGSTLTTRVTDRRGKTTTHKLNRYGSPVEITDPLGHTSTMEWHPSDVLMLARTDANGVRTTFTYDEHANLLAESVSVTNSEGQTATLVAVNEYFPPSAFAQPGIKNRVEKRTDRKGTVTDFTYDERGNLLTQSTAVQTSQVRVTHTVLSNGDRATTRDPRGELTTFTYDAYGNPFTRRDGLGGITRNEWDPRSRLTARSDEEGRRTEIEYDVLGRVIETTLPEVPSESQAPKVKVSFDDPARKISQTDVLGRVTESSLDLEGRIVELRNAAGGRQVFEYDPEGNKTLESSWFDATTPRLDTTFVYDDAGRGAERHEPENRRTLLTFDPVGNVIRESLQPGADTSAARVVETDFDQLNRKIRQRRFFEGGTAETEMKLDGEGNLLLERDPLGREREIEYDELARVTQITEPEWQPGKPRISRFEYDANGNRTQETTENEPADRVRTFTFDDLNRLIRGQDATGGVTIYEYDAVGNRTKVIDPLLNTVELTYDARNRLVEKKERLDRVSVPARVVSTLFGYDAAGNKTEEHWANGNVVELEYDELDRLKRTEDAVGPLATYEFDGRGNRVRETDGNGNLTRSTYDGLNRVTEQRLPEDRTVSFAYDVAGNRTASTNARGLTRTFTYDLLNRLVQVEDPAPFSFETTMTYDEVGNKLTETDRRGHTRTFIYDGLNRLVSEQDAAPLGYQLAYTYDALGSRLTETDRRGITTEYTYDAEGRRTETRRDGLLILKTAHDAAGNARFVTDAKGNVSALDYDERNLLVTESRPEAALTHYLLDDMGDRSQQTDPEGRVSTLVYDARRRLTSAKNGANEETLYTYDGNGNRVSVTRPEGEVWLYRYDGANRLTEVEDPLDNISTYTYDGNGNLSSQKSPRGHAPLFEYDELDRMTAMQYPGGARDTYAYDANGNRTLLTDAKGQTMASTFDENNRETVRTFSASVPSTGDDLQSITTVFDPNNNPLTVAEVHSGPSGTRTTSHAYDTFDRLVTVTDPRGEVISYSYDANGNRTGVTDPDGRTTLYAFDALNRMTSATVAGAGITEYTYFRDSRPKRVVYPNGSRTNTTFDLAGRVATLSNMQGTTATISSFAYLYDRNGNRIEQKETNGSTLETTSYVYDGADRLLEVAYPDKRVVYTYDPAGNRQTEVTSLLSGTVLSNKLFQYDERNRLTSVADSADPAGSATYGYDNNGNQIARTQGGVVTSFLFDVRDQLAEVGQSGTLLETYRYDYRGLRIKKSGPEGLFRYVYDDDSVFLQTDDLGNTIAKYEYGPDRLLSLDHATEGRQFYLFDAMGSVVNLVKPDGGLSIRYQWDAWGNLRSTTGDSFNPFGFTGYEKDNATGLFYAKARFYDPVTGRFLSEDPLAGEPQTPPSLHKYIYAYQNPTVYVDPDGRQSKSSSGDEQSEADSAADFERLLAGPRVLVPGQRAPKGWRVEDLHSGYRVAYPPGYVEKSEEVNEPEEDEPNILERGWAWFKERYVEVVEGVVEETEELGQKLDDGINRPRYQDEEQFLNEKNPSNLAEVNEGPAKIREVTVQAGETAEQTARAVDRVTELSGVVGFGRGVLKGAARKSLLLGAAKKSRGGGGGGAPGMTTFHGTDVDSALEFLNGGGLDAAKAAARKKDGPAGFFTATVVDDAVFFGRRRAGTVIEVNFSSKAVEALTKAGMFRQMIPPGKSARFVGDEVVVPTELFDKFNELLRAGEITFKPAKF